MTRTLTILFFFLFFISCGKSGGGNGSEMKEMTEQEMMSAIAPIQAQTFDINAQMYGFDPDHAAKVQEAFNLIKQVVASDEFKQKILTKSYNGKKQFVDNGGLSNGQIYKKILEGSETLNPGKNNSMDLALETYFEEAIVIGYTYPSIQTIYMNRKYLDKFAANEVAMNLFHEWLHKLGFKHDAEATASRPHSVPYAVGYIVRSLAKKYM